MPISAGVAARALRRLADRLDAAPEELQVAPARDPAVTDAPDAVEHDRRGAAHPDRDRAARARVDARGRDAVEAPLELHDRLRPEPPQQAHLLLEARPARGELHAQRLVLEVVPAAADAEDQPPAAQNVHLRRLLRDERRLALREDHDAADQLDALGQPGEVAEERERFVEGAHVGVGPRPAASFGIGAEHVVVGEQVVVAEALHRLRVVAYRDRVGTDLGLGEDCPVAHQLLLVLAVRADLAAVGLASARVVLVREGRVVGLLAGLADGVRAAHAGPRGGRPAVAATRGHGTAAVRHERTIAAPPIGGGVAQDAASGKDSGRRSPMVIHATRVDYRNAFAGLVFPASKDEIVRRSRMIGGIDREVFAILDAIAPRRYADRDDLDAAIREVYVARGEGLRGAPRLAARAPPPYCCRVARPRRVDARAVAFLDPAELLQDLAGCSRPDP